MVEGLRPHPATNDTPTAFASVWTGETTPQTPLATIQSTIGMALLAMGRADDPADAMDQAASIWARRR
jgi:anthranilate phosphoribosyltransferase